MFNKKENEIYTKHGKKAKQGSLAIVNGKHALVYTKGKDGEIIGYTTLEELFDLATKSVLPQYQLGF